MLAFLKKVAKVAKVAQHFFSTFFVVSKVFLNFADVFHLLKALG